MRAPLATNIVDVTFVSFASQSGRRARTNTSTARTARAVYTSPSFRRSGLWFPTYSCATALDSHQLRWPKAP